MSLRAILFSCGRRSPCSMYSSSDILAFFLFPLSISVIMNTFFSDAFHMFLIEILRATLMLLDLQLERGSAGQSLVNGWRGCTLRQPLWGVRDWLLNRN